ncbi:MAG: hypothetical protein GY821_00225 [Gammaproteobacteria bacterium]|nr:hypothetical protein [Gammaproteobacteria bacterium]
MPRLNPPLLSQPVTLPGLSRMEQWLAFDDYLWVLRQLFGIVLSLRHHPNAVRQLRGRLRQFEKSCLLPRYLSMLPLKQLLVELEDAQYLYPISSREIIFPPFLNHYFGDHHANTITSES